MPSPTAATDFSQQLARLITSTRLLTRNSWQQVPGNNIVGGWAMIARQVTAQLAAAQIAAARFGDAYVPVLLDELGIDPTSVATVEPRALAIGSSGVDLGTVLGSTPLRALHVAAADGVDAGLEAGRELLDGIVQTQVADAGRLGASLRTVASLRVGGYVREVSGGACGRCLVLAGKWYRWSSGFLRHPRCFPAGVVVSGPRTSAAARRWFEGELVVLSTASGQELSLTGNHPILTSRGWVPANLLREGDEVVRSTAPEGAHALVVPDHREMPSRIEDVWGALSVAGFDSVESSPEDFHGDGQHGQVDVVRADGALNGRLLAALAQHLVEAHLSVGAGSPLALYGQGSAELLDLRNTATAGGAVRFGDLSLPLLGGHLGGASGLSLSQSATLKTRQGQLLTDDGATDSVLTSQGILARPGLVGPRDFGGRQITMESRWDAPGDSFSVETSEGYTSLGRDLLNRLSGQVELDRVVESRRVHWSGHVYSLTSVEGWHVANSLIVSNCQCVNVPVGQAQGRDMVTDAAEAFRSMSKAAQDRAFTVGGAQAIRDGADISQVVNARRGISVAGGGLKVTTEGTTSRGLAGMLLPGRVRLMPEAIYRLASDREDAIRLLKLYGYLH